MRGLVGSKDQHRAILLATSQQARLGSGLLIAVVALIAVMVAAVAAPPLPGALPLVLLLGLTQGTLYALLGVGMAAIFRQSGVINFAQGALYMMGGVGAVAAYQTFGLTYWPALVFALLVVGVFGMAIERFLLGKTSELQLCSTAS